jgi:hypothetical protein
MRKGAMIWAAGVSILVCGCLQPQTAQQGGARGPASVSVPVSSQAFTVTDGTFIGPNPLNAGSSTFGSLPSGGSWGYASPWANNHLSVGATLSNSSSSYANEFTMGLYSLNAATPSTTADYFKGALYIYQSTQDSFDTAHNPPHYAKASNAITAYSAIPSGNTAAYSEGALIVSQIEPGGDGQAIGAEIGITNNGTEVNAHCDAGIPKCKTNIWLSNYGGNKASWMIDSGGNPATPSWFNGVALRGVAAGGQAIQIPNSTYITARNAANNNDLIIMHVDAGNYLNLGFATTATVLYNGLYGDATGYKVKRGTVGCVTPGTAGAGCLTTVHWGTGFRDTNYTVTGCMGYGILQGSPVIQAYGNKTAGSIDVQVAALSNSPAQFMQIECTAIHD